MKGCIGRRGFTLIEVVVALVLMGSLVAMSLTALAGLRHTSVVAERRQQAVQLAEQTLLGWQRTNQAIPLRGQGFLNTEGSLIWRTQSLGTRTLCGLPVHVVRLEVLGVVEGRSLVLAKVELIQRAPT